MHSSAPPHAPLHTLPSPTLSVLGPAGHHLADVEIFYGLATPPTSYGGYGGVSNSRKDDGEQRVGWVWQQTMPVPTVCMLAGVGTRYSAAARWQQHWRSAAQACHQAWPEPGRSLRPAPAAKYIFEHPAGWKSETINKRDKGTQGVDCRVRLPPLPPHPPPQKKKKKKGLHHRRGRLLPLLPPPPPPLSRTVSPPTPAAAPQIYNPKQKLQQVFVIVLGRAGEDNRSFRLTNVDSTLSGFAGADYDMLVGAGCLSVFACLF